MTEVLTAADRALVVKAGDILGTERTGRDLHPLCPGSCLCWGENSEKRQSKELGASLPQGKVHTLRVAGSRECNEGVGWGWLFMCSDGERWETPGVRGDFPRESFLSFLDVSWCQRHTVCKAGNMETPL